MSDLLYIGQWQGFIRYGPEYGEVVGNSEAEFRMFIETIADGQFTGRAIDWQGMGANGETSTVKGFVDGHIINFIKEYPYLLQMDEWGNCYTDTSVPGHTVTYEGRYDAAANCFFGTWEIAVETGMIGGSIIEDISTGTWHMARHTD